MNLNYLKTVIAGMAVMCCASMPLQAAEAENLGDVRHLSGTVVLIDVKLGLIQLKSDMSPGLGDVTEYRINKNDTRVTDPLDQKFLSIDDLQVGQYVIIDVVNGQEDQVVKKITAQPYLAPGLEQAFGDLEAIDVVAGTIVLQERPRLNDLGRNNLSYFVFEPKDIVIMQDPSIEPVTLVLKPGDLIRVIYVVRDGKKHAQSITLYVPVVTQTVTTTTTTTQ